MAFYKKPIQPYDPIQKEGQDGGAIRYFRNDFDHTGQNSHDTPPSQDAGQWMALTNTMPISRGNIDRRWGYFALSNLGQLSTSVNLIPKHIYSYQRDTDGLRKLIITTTQPVAGQPNSLAIGEDGSIYASAITLTPSALPNSAPRVIVSRSTAYFYAGVNGSNLKWNGDTVVNKWGINVDDVGASSAGPNLGGTAVAITSGSSGAIWANPNSIKLDDGSYTTATIDFAQALNGVPTKPLEVTNFGLVASGRVTGIQVAVKGHFAITGASLEVVRPTTFTGQFTSPGLAVDGNSSTSAVGTADLDLGGATETWGGFSYTGPTPVGITLNVSSRVQAFAGGVPSAQVEYSLNGGSTWVLLYTTSTARGQTLDQISLPAAQNVSLVKIRATVDLITGTGNARAVQNIVDAWLEVTNNTPPSIFPTISVVLLKNGQEYGTAQSLTLPSLTDTVLTFGSSSDLWGGAWTTGEIDLSNFGLHITASVFTGAQNVISSAVISLDSAKVTVFLVGAGVTLGATSAGSVTLTIGRIYYLAFQNSVTGHPSDLSIASATTGPLTSKQQALTLPVNNDPQVDTKLLLATADGGDPSILYLVSEMPNAQTTFTDNVPEDTLNLNQQYLFTDDFGNDFGIANNTPPPLGTLACKHKGRLWMAVGQLLYFSKSITELTLPNGFVAGRYEEAWPATNYFDISPGAESVTGLLSDGDVLYIATSRHIRRLFGDDPSNFQEPEIVHQEAGVLNQEVWTPIFLQGTPSGTMWLTPDNRVIMSDFNTYRDAGEPIQNVLDTINPDFAQNSHAAFFSQGPYDVFVLAIPTGNNIYCDTHLVFDLRTQQWQVWQPSDQSTAMLFNVTDAGKTQWLFSTSVASQFVSTTDTAYVLQYSSTVTQDRVGVVGGGGPFGSQFMLGGGLVSSTGTDFTSVAQTSWLDLGSPTFRKLLNELEIVGDSGALLTVEGADTQSDFATPEVIVQDASLVPDLFGRLRLPLAGLPTRKRYYRFTFKSTGPSQDMLDSYSIYIIPLSTI